MLTDKDQLEELRRSIDEVDDRIVSLLSRRATLALEIGGCKARRGLAAADPARETLVLDRLAALAAGSPLPPEALREIYAAIIRACREIQDPGAR